MGLRWTIAFAALLALGASGCVERRLFVRSDPPGAKIFLDGAPAGETPAAIPFTYYGTRELVLRAPDRKAARRMVRLSPPWWQILPLDFVTEVLIPWTFHDDHVVAVKLEPAREPTPADLDELGKRAEERRKEGS